MRRLLLINDGAGDLLLAAQGDRVAHAQKHLHFKVMRGFIEFINFNFQTAGISAQHFFQPGRRAAQAIERDDAANEAPLYSEESGFLKAKKRAKDYLGELIPWEFGKYAEETEQQKREWAAAFRKALKEAKKISKSSS